MTSFWLAVIAIILFFRSDYSSQLSGIKHSIDELSHSVNKVKSELAQEHRENTKKGEQNEND